MMDNRSPMLAEPPADDLLRHAGDCLADFIRDNKAHACITLDPCCATCEAILTLRVIDARLGTNRNSITGALVTRERWVAETLPVPFGRRAS